MRTVAASLVLLALLAPHRTSHAEEPAAVDEALRAAEAHETAGRTGEAIAAWKRVLALDPARSAARWALARALAGQGNADSLRAATEHLETLLAAGEDSGVQPLTVEAELVAVTVRRAGHLLGVAGASPRAELLDAAIARAQRVLKRAADHPLVVRSLAVAHAMRGDEAKEKAWTDRYLGLAQASRKRWIQQRDRWQAAIGANASPDQLAFFAGKIDAAYASTRELRLELASAHAQRGDTEGALRRRTALLDDAATHVAEGLFEIALADLDAYDGATRDGEDAANRERAAALRADARRGLDGG